MNKFPLYVILTIFFLYINCSCIVEAEGLNSYNYFGGTVTDTLNRFQLAKEHFIKGSVADVKGNYAEAILEYQEALELDPKPGIHYALSKDYLKLNKLSKALKHAKEAVKLSPEEIEFNFLLANILSMGKQPDSAAVVYEKIISLDSLNFQAYYNLGSIYEQQKPIQALNVYKNLLSIMGPEWNVLIKIADLNERLGNVDETIKTVEDLLDLDPSNLKLKKLLIESYIKTEKYNNALELIEESLEIFPYDLSLIEYKANILIKQEKWEEGSKEYLQLILNDQFSFESKKRIASAFVLETAKDSSLLSITKEILHEIEKDSVDWQILAFLGEMASQEGDDSSAASYFIGAVSQAEWNSQVWNRLGIILFDAQRYEEAISEMNKAISRFPDDFVINIILGLSLSQRNKHEEALPRIKKANSLRPNDLTTLHAYGFTLNQLDKKREAVEYLEKAITIDPSNVQIMGTLGLIYDSLEEFEKSDNLYENAIAIDSTNALILNNYAYSLAERGLQLERALKMSKIAVESDSTNSSYLDTIGWVYYKVGEYQKAKFYVEEAIKEENDNATLIDHLGDIIMKLGDKQKAINYWEKALELDSSLERVKQKIKEAMS
ncbi:tetratricopeptide repeat protein [Bacteroidota bacterium]